MSFENAQIDFDKNLKVKNEEVQGGEKTLTSFKTSTKSLLTRKKNEVASFNATYPGHKEDKTKFSISINSALKRVIDAKKGKETHNVMKKEIGVYKGVLRREANKLRNKMEVKTVERDLQKTVAVFAQGMLLIDAKQYAKAYVATPKAKRIPLADIHTWMKGLFDSAKTPRMKAELFTNNDLTLKTFDHLIKGDRANAVKAFKELSQKLDLISHMSAVQLAMNLKNLSDDTVLTVLKSLVKSGIKHDKVREYTIGGLKKLQKIDPENFESIVDNMRPEDLVQFLDGSITMVNNDKTKKTLDDLRLTILIEGKLTKLKNDSIRKINIATRRRATKEKELKEYRKKHPKIILDKEIAGLESGLAFYDHMLSKQNLNLVMASAKHTLANLYLSKKTSDSSSPKVQEMINTILAAKSYKAFNGINKLCALPRPPQMENIQAASLQLAFQFKEYDTKKWIADNKVVKVYVPVNEYRKEEHQYHPLDIHKRFANTGDLSEVQIGMLGIKYEHNSNSLIKMVIENVIGEDSASKHFAKLSKNNTRTINNLPKREQFNASSSSSGYLNLLNTMRGTSIKIISQLESLLILQKKSKLPANYVNRISGIKQKIAEFKWRAKEYKTKAENVAKFLGRRIETGTDDIDSLAASPLYGPLMNKRLSSYTSRIEDKERAMNSAFQLLGGVQPYVNAKIKQGQPSLIDKAFKDGERKFKSFASSMRDARAEAISVRDDLTKLMKSPALGANIPAAIRSRFVVMIASTIKNINKSLKSPKSPLSLAAIKNATAALAKFRKERDSYYTKKFWTGVAIAGCIVLAAGAAFAGGAVMGALGGKLFGTMAAGGAFVPGAITVSAGTAKVLVGGMIVIGSSAGGVVGSRMAMTGFDVTGVADFGGLSKIWEPKKMGTDFLISCAIGGSLLGLGKGFVGGTRMISKSSFFKARFPKLHSAAVRQRMNAFLRNPVSDPKFLSSPKVGRISGGRLGSIPRKTVISKSSGKPKLRQYWHNNFKRTVNRRMSRDPKLSRKQAEAAVLGDPKHAQLADKYRTLNLKNFKSEKPDLTTPVRGTPATRTPSNRGSRSRNEPSLGADGGTGNLRVGRKAPVPKAPGDKTPVPASPPKVQPVLKMTTALQRERLYYYNKLQRSIRRHLNNNSLKDTAANRVKAQQAVFKKDPLLKAKVEELKIGDINLRATDLGAPSPPRPTIPEPSAVAGGRSGAKPAPAQSTLVTNATGAKSPPAPAQSTVVTEVTSKAKTPPAPAPAQSTVVTEVTSKAKTPSTAAKKPSLKVNTTARSKIKPGRVEHKTKTSSVAKQDYKKSVGGKVAGQTVTPPDPAITEPPKTKVGKSPIRKRP